MKKTVVIMSLGLFKGLWRVLSYIFCKVFVKSVFIFILIKYFILQFINSLYFLFSLSFSCLASKASIVLLRIALLVSFSSFMPEAKATSMLFTLTEV